MKPKQLIFALLFVWSFYASAQNPNYDSNAVLQKVSAVGNAHRNMEVLGKFKMAQDTFKMAVKDSGSTAMKNGTLYRWTGSYWSALAGPAFGEQYWRIDGNGGTTPGSNFIGTTDSANFIIRTNNERMALFEGGVARNIALGKSALSLDQTGLLGYLGTRGENVAIGNQSLQNNIGGSNNTAFGKQAMYNNTTGSYNQAFGVESMSGNRTGIRNIAIGNASINNLQDGYSNIAIGAHSMQNAFGNENALVGHYTNQGGGASFPIGQNAMLGHRAGTWGATGGVFVGYYAHAGVSILSSASYHSTAIGYNSMLNAKGDTSCYALGDSSFVRDSLKNAGAIGSHAYVAASNSIVLGSINGINGATADTKVGIGTTAPTEKLHISGGTVRIVDGNQGSGKVLTSDANGVGSWQTPSGGGITVGTTTIAGGTNTNVLYNNSGVIGEYTTTGSGTVLSKQTNPLLLGATVQGDGSDVLAVKGLSGGSNSIGVELKTNGGLTICGMYAVQNVGDLLFKPYSVANPSLVLQNTTGRVGIGTNNPGYKIEVATSNTGEDVVAKGANPGMLVYSTSGTGRYGFTDGSYGANIGMTSSYDLNFNLAGWNDLLFLKQSNGNAGIGTSSPTEKLDVAGNIKGNHLIGGSSAPSISAGAGAGTSPTVAITGTDMGGYISVTAGTIPSLSATIATVTFNSAYGSAPKCVVITPANAETAILSGASMVFVNQAGITTTTFDITSGVTALTAATAYKWYYHVIQ